MDLLKATKSEILEVFENAREIGEGQEDFYIDEHVSVALMIPMNGKSSDGFQLIGFIMFDKDIQPIGKISRPRSKVNLNNIQWDFRLLPCGFWVLIEK